MRLATIIVSIVLCSLQYKLWVAPGNVFDVVELKNNVEIETDKNKELSQRNLALEHQVENLKYGNTVLEEKARQDMGMVKRDETFYQFIQ